jgi:hypothetical protein
MGICNSSSKTKKENIVKYIPTQKLNEISKYEDLLNRDMPEWTGDRYRGAGIKRMKGYICEIPINELNKLRDEFWKTKINTNKSIWSLIRQACVMDDVRAFNVIQNSGLKTINGCLNQLKDSKGKVYKIPNYCINDPYFEKIIESEDLEKLQKERSIKYLKINIYNLYENKKRKIEINDDITGKHLKEMYCNIENKNYDDYIIRLFYGGSEIKDDHKLYKHHINNDYTLQIMLTEFIKENFLDNQTNIKEIDTKMYLQ